MIKQQTNKGDFILFFVALCKYTTYPMITWGRGFTKGLVAQMR